MWASLASIPAQAWGPGGHRIVAYLAEVQLDDSSRSEVRRLLATSGDRDLADVANWADEMREDPSQREFSRRTSRMHYVNFADARCQYEAEAICAKGQCAVAAIENFTDTLGNRNLPDSERAQALRFLVHLVGDVHQPLHAGYRPDKGGNAYQVRIDGKGSNLHAIWDSRIIGSRHLGWQEYAQRLSGQARIAATGDAQAWAEQSCRITRDDVYPAGTTITPSYLADKLDIVNQQLMRAAARLAALLNSTLD